jgi:hypothetical protein
MGISGIDNLKPWGDETMSNTDPDLRPQAGNKPIAMDVVDGQLIVKRYDGSEESFPFSNDGQVLYWKVAKTGALTGADYMLQTDNAHLYDAQGNDIDSIGGGGFDSTGFDIGDDFILKHGSFDELYFKTPGLYVCGIEDFPDASTINDLIFQVSYVASHPVRRGTNFFKRALPNDRASGVLTFYVGAMDVATRGPLSGGHLSPSVFNDSGSTHNVSAALSIQRVV